MRDFGLSFFSETRTIMGNKPEFYKLKGNDFMNKKIKEGVKTFKENVKELGQDIGSCVKEFATDTCEYIYDHPMVMPIMTFGLLKSLEWGVKLANLSCISANKDGVDMIYVGSKVTKLNKTMNIQDWFSYLEEMYKVNFKKKKQLSYLKDRGFID